MQVPLLVFKEDKAVCLAYVAMDDVIDHKSTCHWDMSEFPLLLTKELNMLLTLR